MCVRSVSICEYLEVGGVVVGVVWYGGGVVVGVGVGERLYTGSPSPAPSELLSSHVCVRSVSICEYL